MAPKAHKIMALIASIPIVFKVVISEMELVVITVWFTNYTIKE
jgi:hypothetical protein